MSVKTWVVASCCVLVTIVASVTGITSFTSAWESKNSSLHPQMFRLLQEQDYAKGWVFLKDKGVSGGQAREDALEQARLNLHPRTLTRRINRRSSPGIVDIHDLPVCSSHVDRVLSTGVKLSSTSRWLNAVSVRGDLRQFLAISRFEFVDRIEPVRRGVLAPIEIPARNDLLFFSNENSTSFYGLMESQLEDLNLVALHNRGYTGSGVVIGLLDTGFHLGHEAFNEPGHEINVIAEYDFIDDDAFTGIETGDHPAQHMHGTMCLGIIAAYLPGDAVGGAFDASFILCKTEDETDEYRQEEDFYVEGLEFIEANGGDVASSSVGYIDWYSQSDLDGLTAVTTIAVNIATSNGLHCCTAAGNNGHDSNPLTSTLEAPSDGFEVLTVGGVDPAGEIHSFSSDGPTADGRVKPEVLARGSEVATVCPQNGADCIMNTSGTSASTPLIASMVACLTQLQPNWTPAQMRLRIFRSSSDYLANGTYDPMFVRGYGIPDAHKAGFSQFLYTHSEFPRHFPY